MILIQDILYTINREKSVQIELDQCEISESILQIFIKFLQNVVKVCQCTFLILRANDLNPITATIFVSCSAIGTMTIGPLIFIILFF